MDHARGAWAGLPGALGLVWEAPQTALGAVLFAACKTLGRIQAVERHEGRVVCQVDGLGVSLGHFVFYFERGSQVFAPDPLMRMHELGHTHQSRRLGPLYLALVGLPSVSRAIYALCYRRMTGRRWTGYYDGYPEKQADAYGGISPPMRRAQLAGRDPFAEVSSPDEHA
jgi:hypothetical protein